MAVLGLSILIASLSFLCYKHPPSSWSFLHWLLRPSIQTGPVDDAPPTAPLTQHDGTKAVQEHTLSGIGPENNLSERDSGKVSGATAEATVLTIGDKDTTERSNGERDMTERKKKLLGGEKMKEASATAKTNLINPNESQLTPSFTKESVDRAAMPPPPPPSKTPSVTPPSFTLSDAAPSFPAANSAQRASNGTRPLPTFATSDSIPSFPAANSAQRASAAVPSFPAMNSAQRTSSQARGPPRLAQLPPPLSGGLMAPPSRSPLPNRGLAPPPTHSSIPSKPRKKVLLTPGHSPLDWAAYARTIASPPLQRVPPSLLKTKTGRKGKEAWTVLGGKVYNISPYLPYHPGGEPELLRCAGKDGTRLFGEVHPWVNWEGMLEGCLVGIAVEEIAGEETSGINSMD